jgi:Na+/melibiose symporter-like transporter
VGTGYAACQMFPLAMLPDVAAADTARTGESRAGTYTGVWTAGETLGLALGPFLYAGVLTLGGYVSSTDASAAQPDSAHVAIALGFTVVPAVLVLASMFVLRSYRLDEEVHR